MVKLTAVTSEQDDVEPRALSSKLRLPALDGVRGLAILLVIVHNASVFPDTGGRAVWLASIAAESFWMGVDLFFVLSGFLITGILLDSRGDDRYFRTFFSRRVLRIFPLYYATLFVAFVVLARFMPSVAADGRYQIWLWTYLDNWAIPLGQGTAIFPHFWSLAVEEQFYVLWPLVVWRLGPRRLVAACAALAVAALLSRVAFRLAGASYQLVYHWTICRMDGLVVGAAVAVLLRRPGFRAWADARQPALAGAAVALFVAGALITRGYPRNTFRSQTVGYTLATVVFGMLILIVVLQDLRGRGWLRRMFGATPLRKIGAVSYGMYVFQTPIKRFAETSLLPRWFPNPAGIGLAWGLAYVVGVAAVSYATAFASYHVFEKRFLDLRARVVPPPAPATPDAA
jgi:peptidoglycan/LPS O-acetylase OafA/YrhL